MSAQAFSKDSQNPYKTGVLVGNHIEDRFGRELTSKPVSQFSLCLIISVNRKFNNQLLLSNVLNSILEIHCLLMISHLNHLMIFL